MQQILIYVRYGNDVIQQIKAYLGKRFTFWVKIVNGKLMNINKTNFSKN